MSTTDKTEEKLLNSMRRTKAAAVDKSAKPESTVARASQNTTAKPAQRARRKSTTASKPGAGAASSGQADPYQSGRRIWPD